MKTRILCTTIAAFAVGSMSASAQEGERPKRELPPEVLAEFDKDGNGTLDDNERQAARASREAKMKQRRQAALKEFDKDGNGELDDDERAAMKKAMEARHAKLLGKYDADKDGKLSKEERQTAIDAGEKIPQRQRGEGARGGRQGKGGPGAQGGPGKGGRPGAQGGPGKGGRAGNN